MNDGAKIMPLALCLAVTGCFQSGNRGWDLGSEPHPVGGPAMEQAWRGVHAGRIGFRCRGGKVFLFVETWDPLDVRPGERQPMELTYRFDAGGETSGSVAGIGSRRGIEVPAEQISDGAANDFLRGLTDDASELVVTLDGATLSTSILFDIEDAAFAHDHVRSGCPTGSQSSPAAQSAPGSDSAGATVSLRRAGVASTGISAPRSWPRQVNQSTEGETATASPQPSARSWRV